MKISIFEDYDQLSIHVAEALLKVVLEKPDAVLCLATGETPIGTYAQVVEQARVGEVDFSKVRFVALDEWVGVPPENSGSCHFFLHKHLFEPLSINPKQVYLFDGMAKNIENECRLMDDHIAKLGGIDFMIVGIGMNGHIGFNEPGIPEDRYAHVVDLDEMTQSVGQKYFEQETILKQGITLGMQHLMEAKSVMVIANGSKKSAIVAQAIEAPISTQLPASLLRKHRDSMFFIDAAAASRLSKIKP